MKKIPIILIVLLIVGSGAYILQQKSGPQLKQKTQNADIQSVKLPVHQTIKSSEDNILIFDELTVEEGKTALELLQETAEIETDGKNENAFVISINGRKADNSKKEFWAFYVNGKQAETGAGSYIIKSNDAIVWKIENF